MNDFVSILSLFLTGGDGTVRVKNWRGGEVVGYMCIDMVGASVVMALVC